MSIKAFFTKFFKRKPIHRYVSDIDKFLAEFNAKNPQKSSSQLKEIKKYERVFKLRDHPIKEDDRSKIWEGF